ncbi:hypothetical protein ACWGI8_12480 [Streptomyces sp. NPDC054841]
MRCAHRPPAVMVAAGAPVACVRGPAGCAAPSVDPVERLGREAAQKVTPAVSGALAAHRTSAAPAAPRALLVRPGRPPSRP